MKSQSHQKEKEHINPFYSSFRASSLDIPDKVHQSYTVQKGDSLTTIAYKFQMNANVLKRMNHLDDFLYPGQFLLHKLILSITQNLSKGSLELELSHLTLQVYVKQPLIGEFGFQEIKQEQIETSLDLAISQEQAYYLTMMGEVKGFITITPNFIVFDGIDCLENVVNEIGDSPNKFHVMINLQDIFQAKPVKLASPFAQNFQNLSLRLAYSHNYYLNLVVYRVNGKAVQKHKEPIASVLFRFSHRNSEGILQVPSLLEKQLMQVSDILKIYLERRPLKKPKYTDTTIHFYDALLHQGINLDYASDSEDYCRNIEYFNGIINGDFLPQENKIEIEAKIPRVRYDLQWVTRILTPEQIMRIAMELPPLIQLKTWKLLYSTAEHGTSFKTFYQKAVEETNTLIVVLDRQQNVYGAFCSGGAWKPRGDQFFGNSQTFIFKIDKSKRFEAYKTTGKTELYLFSRPDTLGIGGSLMEDKGGNGIALSLCENFQTGMTSPSTTFGNPALCERRIFSVKRVEVYGFEYDI